MLKLESNADAISIKILLQPKNLILFCLLKFVFPTQAKNQRQSSRKRQRQETKDKDKATSFTG